MVKNLSASAGDLRDMGLIPQSGRSFGEEHGNPLYYSSLENPMDKEPGRLQFIVLQKVGHNWSDLAHRHLCQTQNLVKYS